MKVMLMISSDAWWIALAAGGAIVLAVLVGLFSMLPQIRRYTNMKRM